MLYQCTSLFWSFKGAFTQKRKYCNSQHKSCVRTSCVCTLRVSWCTKCFWQHIVEYAFKVTNLFGWFQQNCNGNKLQYAHGIQFTEKQIFLKTYLFRECGFGTGLSLTSSACQPEMHSIQYSSARIQKQKVVLLLLLFTVDWKIFTSSWWATATIYN